MKRLLSLFVAVISLALVGCTGLAGKNPAEEVAVKLNPNDYVLKVNTTCQNYSFIEPWQKTRPYSRSGMGILVNGKSVLIPANLVRNHNYVELETLEHGDKTPAKVVHVDYLANLAFVEPEDPKFLKDMKSLEVVEKLMIGAKKVWRRKPK